MERSFGEGYISKVKQAQQQQQGENQGEFNDTKTAVALIAGDVALNQLREVLLVVNGIYFLIIPLFSFYLAKKTLRPIEETHEQQKQFVSDVSHELKTPLSIMNGELEISLQKQQLPKNYKAVLTSTKEEVSRLIALVDNLLLFARIDQKHNPLPNSILDLTDIINNVIIKLKPKIKEKNISVRFIPPEENMPYYGQEVLMSQMFFNLIDNAIKYTNPKGEILIKLEYKKESVVVSIRDNGIGIQKDKLEKIFDRFYRSDQSRSKAKGYGLGLAIAKAIVQKHKGDISVSSIENKGSTFTVKLPNA